MVPASILLGSIIISLSIIFSGTGGGGAPVAKKAPPLENPAIPSVAQLTPGDPVLGEADAPVTIVEYGDYQCSFCGAFFKNIEPVLIRDYVNTGKAKFAFRHLAFLGPESVAAAHAAECAKEQGKFWEYHSALYSEEIADGKSQNGNLNRDLFLRLAATTGLNQPSFTQCMDSGKYSEYIQQANAAASAIGVNSTPSTFVNGVQVIVLDEDGNPVPDPKDGTTMGVGANIQPILDAIEAAL